MTALVHAGRVVLLAGLALLAVGVLPRLALPAPDLVLLVVVAAALLRGWGAGLAWGLIAGWLIDLVPPGGQPLGATALTYGGVGLLVGLLAPRLRWSSLTPLLAVIVAALAVRLVRAVIVLAGAPASMLAPSWWAVLATVLVGAVVVPLLMHLESLLVTRRAT